MAQDRMFETDDLLGTLRSVLSGDRAQRFLIGFLFGMAFFFIAAGLSEVLLARNEVCLESLSDFRIAPDPNEHCMSEFSFFLARGMSRGPFSTLSPSTSPFIAWPVMAVIFGLLGGGFAQLSWRVGIAGFLVVVVVLLMAFMSVDFMAQFIVIE